MGPFDRAPFIVIWETTRACALACVHCRADAILHRHPDELTTAEGRQLIDRVRAFGDPPPLLVLTGGDPLRRPDIADLVAYGTARGLSVSLTPSGTGAATEARLRALRDAGLARLAVSLDGADEAAHDAFRGVRGSHHHTLRILDRARALGLPVQINTTVSRQTVAELPALVEQVAAFGAVLWALFFLVPVGRARAGAALNATEIERVLEWLADLAPRVPFGVKTTEAPHFHRVLAQRASGGPGPGQAPAAAGRPDRLGRTDRAVTDGNGFVFVDHLGEVCPSGFLPLSAGNVRRDDLVAVYRDSALFRSLRDPARLGGRCGRCEYRGVCGGSRARAFAATGDPLAEDPGCAWEPTAAPRVAGAGAGLPTIAGGREDPELRPAATDGGAGPEIAQVMAALEGVFDPELGMSVVELGLVYDVSVRGRDVHVTMTLTTPGCPIHEVMPEWVRSAVLRVPGVAHVEVDLTFDPPWSPDRIRPAAPRSQAR
jgi:radical SAM protein